MKNLIKFIAAAAASVLAVSCVQEFNTPSQAGLPQASELVPQVTVDQETNYVTFSVENKGLVPMWIFGDEKIDGKANKKYAYTGNGISLRIRDAGTHSVTLKAYNANGISQGSQVVTFTLNNTYRDPFDPSPYLSVMANTWKWNSTKDGHFGCGPSGGAGLDWWSCGAGEKEGMSLYDDRMTFTADSKYSYDSGDGLVYVNWESGFNPEGHEAEIAAQTDYATSIDNYTCDFYLENEWNAEGIEEVYLVLPEGKNLSYIPNKNALSNPRWRLISTKPADIKKCLDLVIDDGNIAWRYQFVPHDSGEDPEPEPEDNVDWDITGARNLWKSATITPEYWYSPADWSGGISAQAEITENNGFKAVIPEGVGGSEWMAQNKLISDVKTEEGQEYDFRCTFTATEDMTVTVKLTGNPEGDNDGHAFFYNGSVKLTAFESYTFKMPQITQAEACDNLMLIFDYGRSPVGSTIEVTDICFQKHKEKGGASGTELWDNSKVSITYWYSAADWSGALKPEISEIDGGWSVVVPEGIGGSEWQGQTHFTMPAAVSASKKYTFKITLNSSTDCTCTVKLAWEGNDNDHAFFYDNGVKLTSYENVIYVQKEISPDVDYDKLALFVDLGRTPAGSVVEIKDISLIELESEGTDVWDNSKTTISYWYSAGDWSGALKPEISEIDGGWSVVVPEGIGGSEWQGQTHFTMPAAVSPDKKYTFKVTLNSSEECTCTVKLAWEGNDNDHAMFYDNAVKLTAYDDVLYVQSDLAPDADWDKLALFVDLGRTPAGAVVEIKDIHLYEK